MTQDQRPHLCAALRRGIGVLDHDERRAFAEDESIASRTKRHRTRRGIPLGVTEDSSTAECSGSRRAELLRSARDQGARSAELDEVGGVGDRISARVPAGDCRIGPRIGRP